LEYFISLFIGLEINGTSLFLYQVINGIKMEDNSLDDILKRDVNIEINQQIHKCFRKFGIEGTEQKLKDLYSLMPTLKDLFLTEYYKIIRK